MNRTDTLNTPLGEATISGGAEVVEAIEYRVNVHDELVAVLKDLVERPYLKTAAQIRDLLKRIENGQ